MSYTHHNQLVGIITTLADKGIAFSSDDVQNELEKRGLNLFTPNDLGAAFRSASIGKKIIGVGYTKSQRPEAHSRVIRTWSQY